MSNTYTCIMEEIDCYPTAERQTDKKLQQVN